ncbi:MULTISPECIES: hypothetical protein [unclassified Roseitalea]|uniref:hypothetical protein n=1 Tax=unclassified Roseitalea TaxID=2639107 RepID=UPI00274013F9|nr:MULTISPECIES: hypothetical protein [unclassified Roseitalea]
MSDNGRNKEPVKSEVGDPVDIERTALSITPGDVRAMMVSEAPAEERLAELQAMRREVLARVEADPNHELAPIERDLDNAIAALRRQMGMDEK